MSRRARRRHKLFTLPGDDDAAAQTAVDPTASKASSRLAVVGNGSGAASQPGYHDGNEQLHPIKSGNDRNADRRTSKASKRRLLLQAFSPILHRRIKRIAVWIAILGMIAYRYWTGRTQFPLACNLFGLRCPEWPISGTIADGFEGLVDAFKANFEEGNEVGASFSAYVGESMVAELYGGYHNKRYSRPYDQDSLQLVFSSSKFMESMVMTYLVDKGILKFSDRIAKYWPEFGQGNKDHVTIENLLSHRAGVTYLSRPPSLTEIANLDLLSSLLAAQPHNFNGSSVQGYHAVTRGWYLNEIVRRADPQRRTIGKIVRQEFMPALLGTEFYLALPKSLESRLSHLIAYPTLRTVAKVITPASMQSEPLPSGFSKILFERQSVSFKAIAGSQPKQIIPWPHGYNRRAIWGHEGPSYSGVTNAKSLAKFAALMANNGSFGGVQLISPEAVAHALEPMPWMSDAVVARNVTFARGGWGINVRFPGSEHVGWVGWGGVGGSMVWWNPEKRIAFSYVMNSLSLSGIGDRRSWRLIAELVKAVEAMERKAAGRDVPRGDDGAAHDKEQGQEQVW
ncbi:beta-lactamase/transpeptidase-like protein [Entophlyctis helioformis]|nr:beta-lactamase/transpeptidase-like protein [Entophlyctis helioformis]